MQPDAVQTQNKPFECRVILLGALSSWLDVSTVRQVLDKLACRCLGEGILLKIADEGQYAMRALAGRGGGVGDLG